MNEDLGFRTAACSEYERLLEACKAALMAWKTRRETVVRFGPYGRSSGDELQKLQAEYARAYNRLDRHSKSCEACRFVKALGKQNRPATADPSFHKEVPA